MNEKDFRRQLEQDGYDNVQVAEWEPNTVNDTHTHDFAAYLLVLAGDMSVQTEQGSQTCQAGDTFSLDAGVPHSETVGAEGVRFLSGRK